METITPTLPQPLRDETASAPSIAGEPRLPHGDTQRIPAVLMLHGDAGAPAGQASSSEQLDAAGIAVLTLDSFSGRGALATESSFGVDAVPDRRHYVRHRHGPRPRFAGAPPALTRPASP